MASSKAETLDSAIEIKNVCPICFESFKTPRYLPCFHTFCHNCLSSYILSTCKSKENPVGFPCPLCRQFVPAPSSIGEPEKWTELIPINTIVKTICEKKDQFCDACRRTEEEEVATDWCRSCVESLCRTCAKFHKKNAASQNHELIPLSDKGTVPVTIENRVLCIDHNAPAKYLCVDHEELCCGECVCTKHRKCYQVDEIEKIADNLIQSGTLKKLAQEILKHNDVLLQAKTEGDTTMKHIDETSDNIAQESTDLRDKLVRHINGGDIFGECFLENGDILLADCDSRHCLIYSNNKLVRKLTLEGYPWDVMYRKPSELLISTNVKGRGHIAHYSHVNLQKFKNITESNVSIFQLAKSSEFIYAACATFILKLDHGGHAVEQIAVDDSTYSVAVIKRQEIISSSCHTNHVTVRNQSGVRIYSYSHKKLRHPYGLDVNFTGNIFVAGQLSNNIHVLTFTAELLRIFEVASPRCIKFKENSYTCIVGSVRETTKVYEFFQKGLEA